MWWQYVIVIVASLFIALIAVRFDHWLSGRNEYRRAIISLADEIAANTAISELNCKHLEKDLDASKAGKQTSIPYEALGDLAWSSYKSDILLRNPNVAKKMIGVYMDIPTANRLLDRIEEFKWGAVAAITSSSKKWVGEYLELAKAYISEQLLPHLKEAQEALQEALEKENRGWLKKRPWC